MENLSHIPRIGERRGETPETTNNGMNALTWSLLLALGLIWGGSFFFARIAVHSVPPFTLVFLRLSLAALALHLYIAGRLQIYDLLRTHWRQFLLLGLINNAIPHVLIFIGQTQMGAGLASILNATTPIWTVLIGNHFTTDERLTPTKLAGCLTGLAGTIVLLGPSVTGAAAIPLWALLLPILAAISYGFAAIYAKRFKGMAPPVVAAGQLTGSSIIMLPAALLVDHPWTLATPPASVIAAILGMALLSTPLPTFSISASWRSPGPPMPRWSPCSSRQAPSCSASSSSANDWDCRKSSACC